jgi:uncharacterized protein (TIGR02231 family)
MKKFIFVCLSFAFTPAIAQRPQEIKAPITSVKVCLNAAQITHSKNITIKAGKNKMAFVGLAMNINKNNISLRNFGNSELLSLSLIKLNDTTNILSLPDDLVEMIKKSKDTVIAIEKGIEKLVYEIEGLELERGMLVKNDDIIANGKSMTTAELKTTTEYYRTRYAEVNLEISNKNRQLKQMRKSKIHALKSAFDVENSQEGNMNISIVMVELNNTGAEYNSDVELVYVAKESGWIPVYDMYAAGNKNLKINYRAKVLNNTGIDWNNMKLTLSTTDPTEYYASPDLEPFYVNRYNAPNKYSSNSYNDYDDNYQTNNSNSQVPNQQQMPFQQQEEEIFIPETEITFNLAKQYTMKAGTRPFMVDVINYDLTPEFAYRTAPKKEEQVFSIARIKDWEKLNLIDGEASIYNNGSFLGKCYIKPSTIEDFLELPLGVMENIYVKHKLVSEVSNKRSFSGGITATFTYEIKVKNNGNEKITLEVIDQVPISESGSVKTDIIQLTEGGVQDPLTGKILWIVDLGAANEKTFDLKYSVSYPRGYSYSKGYKKRAIRAKF